KILDLGRQAPGAVVGKPGHGGVHQMIGILAETVFKVPVEVVGVEQVAVYQQFAGVQGDAVGGSQVGGPVRGADHLVATGVHGDFVIAADGCRAGQEALYTGEGGVLG